MPDDIYTRAPIVTPTDEHLLLNALGGRAVVPDLIDRDTNSTLGDTIDAALAVAVLPVRALLHALSGDGTSPPPYRGATGPDGTKYNVLPGGKPEIGKPRLTVTKENGTIRIEGSVRSMSELRRLLGRTVRQHGLDMSRLEDLVQHVEEASPRLNMRFSFTPESARAVAKMACNLFARTHKDEFMSASFDPIRAFVRDGTGEASDFVLFNTKPVDVSAWHKNLGPLDHVLLVRSVGREITALVAIYEHLQFIVRLGIVQRDLPVASAYRIDQIGRGHRIDDRRDIRLPVRSFAKISGVPIETVFQAMHDAAVRLLRVVMDRHRGMFEKGIIEESIRDAFGEPDGMPITMEMIEKLSHVVAERWTSYLYRQGYFDRSDD